MPDSGHEPTLRELAIRLDNLDANVQLQLQYHQAAITKAATELDNRLVYYNHFRDLLSEQVSHFITVDQLKDLDRRLTALELAKSNLEGRFWAVTAIVVLIEMALVVWELLVRR